MYFGVITGLPNFFKKILLCTNINNSQLPSLVFHK